MTTRMRCLFFRRVTLVLMGLVLATFSPTQAQATCAALSRLPTCSSGPGHSVLTRAWSALQRQAATAFGVDAQVRFVQRGGDQSAVGVAAVCPPPPDAEDSRPEIVIPCPTKEQLSVYGAEMWTLVVAHELAHLASTPTRRVPRRGWGFHGHPAEEADVDARAVVLATGAGFDLRDLLWSGRLARFLRAQGGLARHHLLVGALEAHTVVASRYRGVAAVLPHIRNDRHADALVDQLLGDASAALAVLPELRLTRVARRLNRVRKRKGLPACAVPASPVTWISTLAEEVRLAAQLSRGQDPVLEQARRELARVRRLVPCDQPNRRIHPACQLLRQVEACERETIAAPERVIPNTVARRPSHRLSARRGGQGDLVRFPQPETATGDNACPPGWKQLDARTDRTVLGAFMVTCKHPDPPDAWQELHWFSVGVGGGFVAVQYVPEVSLGADAWSTCGRIERLASVGDEVVVRASACDASVLGAEDWTLTLDGGAVVRATSVSRRGGQP